jgi:hypothetical protein
VDTLKPEDCNRLVKAQEAKGLAIAFTHKLRRERRDDPNATPIPYLSDKPELRYALLREVAPLLAPLLVRGEVQDSTVLGLVREFFDRRLPANKASPVQPRESKSKRHLNFPDAPTDTGRIEFEDRLAPVTVEGLDGEPVQVVTREFITAELEKRIPGNDPIPVDMFEVRSWLQKNLEPYPMKVLLHGERANNRGQAYLLSDVLIALRDHPLRSEAARLDASGRAHIEIDGVSTEVVTAGGLSLHRAVDKNLVSTLLTKLKVEPLEGVQLREPESERTHKVYAARAADPIISLLSSKEGVAIPVGNFETPFRVAMTLPAYATRFRHPNLYQLEQSLGQQSVTPIKAQEIGLALEDKGKALGRLLPTVYAASLPESDQSRFLMADSQGTLLAFSGQGITDIDKLYWLDELESALPNA